MNVLQAMRCYHQILDYFKPCIIEYFLSQDYNYSDRTNIMNLYSRFVEMCPYDELFLAMIHKEQPEIVVKRIAERNKERWLQIVDSVCASQ